MIEQLSYVGRVLWGGGGLVVVMIRLPSGLLSSCIWLLDSMSEAKKVDLGFHVPCLVVACVRRQKKGTSLYKPTVS